MPKYEYFTYPHDANSTLREAELWNLVFVEKMPMFKRDEASERDQDSKFSTKIFLIRKL